MSTLKRKHPQTGEWLVVGDTAESISLSNPNYMAQEGATGTVADGFMKLENRLDKIERNIAYIYKEGTLGGGGGFGGGGGGIGGGASGDSIQLLTDAIISDDKKYIYISSTTAEISFYIKSSSVTAQRYAVTVTAGGSVLPDWNGAVVYTKRNAIGPSAGSIIKVTDVNTNTAVVISAVDEYGNELDTMIVYVRPGTYTFNMENYSATREIYYNQISSYKPRFVVTNNIPNSTATVRIKCQGLNTVSKSVSYEAGSTWNAQWSFESMLGTIQAQENSEYNITAEMYIDAIDSASPVSVINFTVSVLSSTSASIIISGNNLTRVDGEIPASNEQTVSDNIVGTVKVLGPSEIRAYYLAYRIYYNISVANYGAISASIEESGDFDETLHAGKFESITFGSWDKTTANAVTNDRVTAGVTISKSFSVQGIQPGYFYLKIKSWSVDGNGGDAFKIVKGYANESDNIFVYDFNSENTLAVQYNAYRDIHNIGNASTWVCTTTDDTSVPLSVGRSIDRDENGKEVINLIDNDDTNIKAARTMNIYRTNGSTSGFINNELTGNAPALRFAGNAYGMINYSPFAPESASSNVGKFQNSSWTLSFTFKSDSHPDSNGTILDIGDYQYDKNEEAYILTRGLHVGLDEVTFKFVNGTINDGLSAKLIQNNLTTIDIVYESDINTNTASLKLYVNGVCNDASFFNKISDARVSARSVIWLGRRILSSNETTSADQYDRPCDFNLYDLKFYMSALNDYAIVRNYINAKARVELVNGNFDWHLINTLRNKNYMVAKSTTELSCSVVDKLDNYNVIDIQSDTSNIYDYITRSDTRPIPVLLIEITSNNDRGFFNTYRTIYSTTQRESATDIEFKCKLTYTPATGIDSVLNNTVVIEGSSGGNSPYVTLQGTSTLTYAAKNLEIYFGDDGVQPRLFTPKAKSWLPENRFTLKADVVDSSHCNNASMGKFINESGIFESNPAQTNVLNQYRGLVKHTLEGFPCYVFVKYVNADPGAMASLGPNITTPQFMGIYSFNLGRGAYYNTGFEVLDNYKLDISDVNYQHGPYTSDIPAIVSEYEQMETPYPNSAVGCVSYECLDNDNEIFSFQNDDDNIINNYYQEKYPGNKSDVGFRSFKRLFTTFANCYNVGEDHYKYTVPITSHGDYGQPERIGDEQYSEADAYYQIDAITKKLNWNAANAYYLTTQVFGLVDSLGKNSTYRTWETSATDPDVGQWYCCFYDMDTGLGLNNAGQETVEKSVYTRKFSNIIDGGYSNVKMEKFNTEPTPENPEVDNIASSYSCWNGRLWNVVTEGILNKDGNIEGLNSSYGSFRDMWYRWRSDSTKFMTADTFMENYYKAHIGNIGELMYNIDYRIKYINPCNRKDEYDAQGNVLNSYRDDRSITFLHGRRTEYVQDWLKDRLYFLDAIFYYKFRDSDSKGSQYMTLANNNPNYYPFYNTATVNSSTNTTATAIDVEITSASPCIFSYKVNNSLALALLNEDQAQMVTVPASNSNIVLQFNLLNLISKFKNFKKVGWSNLSNFKAPNLTEFDLSGMNTLTTDEALGSGQNNIFLTMTELRTLNLNNTILKTTNNATPAIGLSVDVSKCTKLIDIDITNSHVSSITLPKGGCITSFKANGSLLTTLTLSNQTSLVSDQLEISKCSRLTTLNVDNCDSLKILDLADTILETVTVTNCNNLETLILSGNVNLSNLVVSNCPKLSYINLYNAGTNVAPEDVSFNLAGAPTLQRLNLMGCKIPYISLNGQARKTLNYINLNGSNVSQFKFDDEPLLMFDDGTNTYRVLDFSGFDSLTSSSGHLYLDNNKQIQCIKFDNIKDKYFDINNNVFASCSDLRRVFGHLRLNIKGNTCNIFAAHANFKLNNPNVYTAAKCKIAVGNGYEEGSNTNKNVIDTYRNVWLQGEYATNIDLGPDQTSLSKLFDHSTSNSNNNITIYDVYYMLAKCDKITNIDHMFANCDGIKTSNVNPLARHTFKYCRNVVSAQSVFYQCSNIAGPIFSPRAAFEEEHRDDPAYYDGTYSPLVNAKSCAGIFSSSAITYVDSFAIWKTSPDWTRDGSVLGTADKLTCGITSMYGSTSTTSVVRAGLDHTHAPLKSSLILKYCPNLLSTRGIFSTSGPGTEIEFETAVDQYTKKDVTLFWHNSSKVVNIVDTFKSCNATLSGVINYTVFGGGLLSDATGRAICRVTDAEGETIDCTFVNNITDFSGVFTFIGTPSVDNPLCLDWDGFDALFDNQNKRNITSVAQMLRGNMKKGYKKDGSRNTSWPYSIFSGMSSLESVEEFFYNHGITSSRNNPVSLPGSMFLDCTSLQSIKGVFKNGEVPMMVNNSGATVPRFYVSLTPNGFVNCHRLEIVDEAFQNVGSFSDSSNPDKAYLGIPYSFFNQGYYEEEIECSPENFESGSEFANLRSFRKKYLYRTISSFQNVFAGCTYMCNNKTQYHIANIRTNENGECVLDRDGYCGDIITDNFDFDPRKYIAKQYDHYTLVPIMENGQVIRYNPVKDREKVTYMVSNPDYSPKKILWNPWCWDGIYRDSLMKFRDQFKWIAAETTEVVDEYGNTTITNKDVEVDPLNLKPYCFINCEADKINASYDPDWVIQSAHNSFSDDPDGAVYGWSFSNYIVPADLLRYCADACIVINGLSSISANTLHYHSSETRGYIRGRIPPYLLWSLTKTQSFNSLFAGNYYAITPWIPSRRKADDINEISSGLMFAPETFEKNAGLTNVSNMFSYINVLRDVTLPHDMFIGCPNINTANNLFYDASWGGGTINRFDQVGNLLDSSGTKLKEISSMFYYSNGNRTPETEAGSSVSRFTNGCGKLTCVDSNLFYSNKGLSNVSSTFANCDIGGGRDFGASVPELWVASRYPLLVASGTHNNTFTGNTHAYNASSIPSAWK